MADKFITFEPNELEIAIVTYNRCEFIKEWLTYCYEEIKKRKIRLSIYDSSTDNHTKQYINDFIKTQDDNIIQYFCINSNVNIGYKPMFPILNSKAKYIWVSGDSRCHNFEYLDKKVFPYLKLNIDYVVFHIVNNEENDGKVYTDKDKFLRDCFISMTCIGLSIYKTALFNKLKDSKQLMEECDLKYKNNYAFSWIGYFLEAYSRGKNNAVFLTVPIINIKSEEKIQSWFKRFYECWCENLCSLMDSLSDTYSDTEKVISNTWKYMRLDSPWYCYKARNDGDLTQATYKKYLQNGMLRRVSNQINRIECFASMNKLQLKQGLNDAFEQEEKDFLNLCKSRVNKIKDISKGKDIWIYGAGTGGKILKICLEKYNIPISGFIDKNAVQIKECSGLLVKSIDSVSLDKSYIIISLFKYFPFIITSLIERGAKREMIYFLTMDED